ncbi:MAG: efflux RND transporter periplasmic adaptor subunit [Rhodospirillaceae bacterium]
MTRLIIIGVLAVALIGTAYVYLGDGGGDDRVGRPTGPRPGVPVEMMTVTTQRFIELETAVGSLASDEAVILRSEIAGRVEEIGFIEGQPIAKGDLIITIDDDIYRAEFNQAEARLKLSQANYDRAVDLENRGAGTQRALDEASSKLQEDRATLDLAKARLERTEIRAPFSGVIGIRRVSPGDYLTAGQEIVNLEAIDPIKVAFALPEVLLSVVQPGQSVRVSVDAFPDETFEGEVYAIDPRIAASGRSVTLRAVVPNPDGRLRPGLFARIAIIFGTRENAIMIPERALVPVQGRQTLFVVENGVVSLRDVETGSRRNGQVEVTSGLEPGEQIVTAGQLKLREGSPVVDVSAMTESGA